MVDFNKDGLNDAILNNFAQDVVEGDLHEGYVAKHPERVSGVWDNANRYLRETDQKLLDVIDFEYLFKNLLPQSVFEAFDSGVMDDPDDLEAKKIREHVATTIQSTSFDRMFDTCIPQILQDFSCPEAPFTLRDRVTTPVTLDCRNQKFCEMPMPEMPDLCCMGEDESTPWLGEGSLRCWKTPNACKVKFAVGYNREMLCRDPNGLMRDHIASLVSWFDEMDEYALIKMLIGAEGCDPNGVGGVTNCRFPFNYMDVEYDAYLDAAAAGPWLNLYEDVPELSIDGCSDVPLVAIESLYENERDHCTGRPIRCLDELQVVIPYWADRRNFLRAMSPRELVQSGVSDPCTREDRTNEPARDGWSTSLIYSPYMMDKLTEYYLNCHSTTANQAATAELWARNTYVVGNPRAALGFGTEWALESLERTGTDNWEYFDREVVYARKYMRKVTPMWLKPWMVKLIRAFDSSVNPA